ncbi:MAG: D-alanyl-D-alanine carboxypeptidase/D-alanyl-D-alanine-endopeptidase [Rhodobacteraceae bacterium]|nr:D-alanyl-D-alanine carboxypeptidase/D-alanyl-D-alanine-endopeptidase [Paracoccaceae bacterium]
MTKPFQTLSRRWFLGALLASAAPGALAQPLTRSLRPAPRPEDRFRAAEADQLIARAGLGGKLGYVVADARTGQALEVHNPLLGLPPASVAKAVTAVYALETLGAGHRFVTRVIATGPLRNGRLEGDLVLVGGGDPTLDTDMLGELAGQLKAAGLHEVTGRFLYHAGALPDLPAIDPDQPDHVGYNPAISGLNLNFNRVHFEWHRAAGGYDVTMDARAARFSPRVSVAQMQVVDRAAPVYTYSSKGGVDEWTVAEGALGKEGARWLPVRRPALYCAEVFQTLIRAHGIVLPAPLPASAPPQGVVLAQHQSEPLAEILREMLKYSTNMTAEAVGLSATIARGQTPAGLPASARAMTDWLATRMGVPRAHLVDHSGLGPASRVSAREMVRVLVAVGPDGPLKPLLKSIPMRDAQGRPVPGHPVQVRAKTGTLNFVSGLAGYITTGSGRELAFAIFSADQARRDAVAPQDLERPPGGRTWVAHARRLQQDLVARWAEIYG